MAPAGNSHAAHRPTPAGDFVSSATIRGTAEQILEDLPFFARTAPNAKIRQQLLDCLDNIALPAPIAAQLAVAQDRHHEVYLQLVRATLVATWLARTPALPRCDPATAAAGGLLHDIGMLHVDPAILARDPGQAAVAAPGGGRHVRAQALEALATSAAQMQRVLAGAGAVPEQLRLLAPDAQDDALRVELTLLTREACWQLSSLALQCRRRWQPEPGETCPPVLKQWLDAVGVPVLTVSGVSRENPQEGEAPAGAA